MISARKSSFLRCGELRLAVRLSPERFHELELGEIRSGRHGNGLDSKEDVSGLMDFLRALVSSSTGGASNFSSGSTDGDSHTRVASGNSFRCPGTKRICSLLESWNFSDLERQQAEAADAKSKEKEAKK